MLASTTWISRRCPTSNPPSLVFNVTSRVLFLSLTFSSRSLDFSLDFIPRVSFYQFVYLEFCLSPCLCHLSFFLYLGFHLLSHQPICQFHLELWIFRLCLLSFYLFYQVSWLVIVSSISIYFSPFSGLFSRSPEPHRNICPCPPPIQLLSSNRSAPHSIPRSNLKTLHIPLAQSTPAFRLRTPLRNKIFYGTLLSQPIATS